MNTKRNSQTRDNKYFASLINLANIYSQATRPKNVGKLMGKQEIEDGNSLVAKFNKKYKYGTKEKWKKFYDDAKIQNGDETINGITAIRRATQRIEKKLKDMKINHIERRDVKYWVEDLIYNKTFDGCISITNAVVKELRRITKRKVRLANAKEESMNIDLVIGKTPVNIKPISYKRSRFDNHLTCPTIFYEKIGANIKLTSDEIVL